MPKPDFTLKIIKDAGELGRLSDLLVKLPAFALDIETIDWWNRQRERIALIQIAYRNEGQIKVFIIDALARFEPEPLRLPLEKSAAVKIIHNASFDAARLQKHYNFSLAPIFDTMIAARRAGERKYSLKAQAETHLGIPLDKSARESDWSRRPLDNRQIYYAALDSFATLLLYENQMKRGIRGDYLLKPSAGSLQNLLPLDDAPADALPAEVNVSSAAQDRLRIENSSFKFGLSEVAIALLGIITELPTRYSPDAMAATAGGSERSGMAGWIIDRRLSADAELDEDEIKIAISGLCELQLVEITETRRLKSTAAGERLWRKINQTDKN
jgi:hypothetical protein